MEIQPRVIRLRDAPAYLGMDKNRFNAEVRPYLVEIPIGSQGIGFDRLDLDRWFEDYKECNGRRADEKGGKRPWREKKSQGSSTEKASGTSRRDGAVVAFEKAVERAISTKRNDT
ncbi:MAG: hypothetical protein FJY85_13130 [Deltaproteobacteria bacterium]|nr:hypothetical protein [Deltaproteobacteria bacterium]